MIASLALAEQMYRRGEHAAIVALLGPEADAGARDPRAVCLLGLALVHLGDIPAALRWLREARDQAPRDSWTALYLGIGLRAAGEHREAAALFQDAAAAAPFDPTPLLHLATALLTTGDIDAAARAARRARARAPDMAEAHQTLGLVRLAQDRLVDAEACFARATGLAPKMAEAWINLGVTRYRLDNVRDAEAAMRQALRMEPENRTAAANLAVFLRLGGALDGADDLLRETAREPDAAEARLNLAVTFVQEDRLADALKILDAPPPAEPRARCHWRLQHALALARDGQTARAKAVIAEIGAPPRGLRPVLAWCRVVLAEADGDPAGAARAAAAVAAALDADGPAMLPEHRVTTCFDLAGFWSGQGQPDRAFALWTRGHALLRTTEPFSRAGHRAFVDASIAHFAATRLRGPRASNRDQTPVFIVGMPRSGTTLCERILAAHPAAHGAGEREALGMLFETLGGDREHPDAPARIAALSTGILDQAATGYLAKLKSLAPAAARVVDKMPGNSQYLGLVGLALPGARIIHCTRDPRDIGLSMFGFRFLGRHPHAHDLGDLGWYIGEHDRLMAHWRSVLPNPILTVALRDWVEDFDATLRRVLAFLGLPHAAACERFHEDTRHVRTISRSQVRAPINARGLGRWRAHAAHLEPLITELALAGLVPDAARARAPEPTVAPERLLEPIR